MNLKSLIICHRKNTIKQLVEVPTNFGVEIDVRSYKNKIKNLKNFIKKNKIHIDVVCTKNPEIWNK